MSTTRNIIEGIKNVTSEGVTKAQVGLSNVDNTTDVNKPVSTATQTALNLKANLASPTFTGTVSGISKSMVGLGSVDNTTDANKPVSTATQTALNGKAPIASPVFTGDLKADRLIAYGSGGMDTNVAVGSRALTSNTTGFYNTAIGRDALYHINTGKFNSSFGTDSLCNKPDGSLNTDLSNCTGLGVNTKAGGNYATAIGHEASAGGYATAIGYNASAPANCVALGTSSERTLVAGAVDNGTDALQVNGSIKVSGSINSGGQQYGTWVESMQTSDGGVQNVRVVEDCFGRWLVVGKFDSDASFSVASLISTVRGLSTSLEQNDATNFSADFGSSYPTEVRFMGATDFARWKDTRTIDWVYRVPAGKLWKDFLVGSQNGRFGFNVAGAYDGFGRWNNPTMNFMRMSDTDYTNPVDAYINPTANAINFNTAQDAKFSVTHNDTTCGQDYNATSSFGNDDGGNNFFDAYPSTYSNHSGTKMYTSAVWLMIKLN